MIAIRATLAALAILLTLAAPPLASSASAPPTSITEFSAGLSQGSKPEDIVVGPDGNLWFTDKGADGAIGRITPSGVITEFSSGLLPGIDPVSIVPGPDDNLWFTDHGTFGSVPAIGRITTSGAITLFSAGLNTKTRPIKIVVGPEGNLWFTASGSAPAIGRVTPSGAITTFYFGAAPNSITVGPDGNIWFAVGSSLDIPGIGQITQAEDGTTTITLFRSGLNAGARPRDIVAGPDGNLWFADASETIPAIGRITPSGEITEFSGGLDKDHNGPLGEPVVGPDGNLWFLDWMEAIGRITPSGAITEFPLDAGSRPSSIVSGADGRLWFTEYQTPSAVGHLTTNGAVTELRSGLGAESSLRKIINGPDGNLWFTDPYGGAVGRVVPGDDSPRESGATKPPALSGPTPTPLTGVIALFNSRIVVQGRVARVGLRCIGNISCGGRLTLSVRQPVEAGRKGGRPIGSVAFWMPPSARKISLRLNRTGRALLRAGYGRLDAALMIVKNSPGPRMETRGRRVHLVARETP